MRPVRFAECNFTLAERQGDYQPLPAHWSDNDVVTTCWQLTEEEKRLVQEHGHIFIQQLTFKHPLQPQLPCVLNPLTNKPPVVVVQHEEVLRRQLEQAFELLSAIKPPETCPFCDHNLCISCTNLAKMQVFIQGKIDGIKS